VSARGFTLVELLIGMALSLIILVSGVAFFGHARGLFFKLKDAEEDAQAVYSALDRIRLDLAGGGRGLAEAIGLDLLSAVEAGPEKLTILSSEGPRSLTQDLAPGGSNAVLDTTEGIRKGDRICFLDGARGEVRRVASLDASTLILDLPSEAGFPAETCRVLPVEQVSYYLRTSDRVVRRQVNSSSAQPLIEDVGEFRYSYDLVSNLAAVTIGLAPHKERIHGILVFPKNAGLFPLR
jgi:prepilin-type N-terminal cleavage/methylation domain-containing protein